MILPIETPYPTLQAKFYYFSTWPMYFDVNSDGEIIKPESMFNDMVSFMGLQRFSTLYDVSFPVLIKITQPEAFKGDGYSFLYMIESNVRNNKPLETDFDPIIAPDVSPNTMFCDQNKRLSGDLNFSVVDKNTDEPINDAAISYSCTEESCMIGITDTNGKFNSRFPICFGGVINVIKNGYITEVVLHSTEINKNENIEIEMRKIVDIPVKVMKKRFSKSLNEWVINPNPLNMDSLNEGILTFNLQTKDYENSYSSALFFNDNESDELYLRLAPGKYDISGNLFYNGDVVIPKETRTENGFSYTLPELNFGSDGGKFSEGGIELSNVTITYDELANSDTLIVYMVSMNPGSFKKIEDVSMISVYEDYSEDYRIYFEPEFVTE